MDFRYLHLLMNVREITAEGYDPNETIQAFWDKYSVNDSRLHILNMSLIYRGEVDIQDGLNEKAMEQFAKDLMKLLMAYYVVHHEKINLDNIQIPVEEAPEKSEEEKIYGEILYSILGLRHFEQKINR